MRRITSEVAALGELRSFLLLQRRRGGTGRRAGLKIQYSQECVGSNPSAGKPKIVSDPLLPTQQLQVKLSMERTGFQRVRLETFPQGHNVKPAHVREALRWFPQLQTAP